MCHYSFKIFWFVCGFIIGMAIYKEAFAHDKHGAPISRSMHDWFMDLKNQQGYPCCSDADGANVSEADWDAKGGHYRVRIEGEWVDVPDEAVITVPNKYGLPMVWLQYLNGERIVRCFMPGAGG